MFGHDQNNLPPSAIHHSTVARSQALLLCDRGPVSGMLSIKQEEKISGAWDHIKTCRRHSRPRPLHSTTTLSNWTKNQPLPIQEIAPLCHSLQAIWANCRPGKNAQLLAALRSQMSGPGMHHHKLMLMTPQLP